LPIIIEPSQSAGSSSGVTEPLKQRRRRDHDLEGGARRIDAVQRAVGPSLALLDVRRRRGGEVRRERVEVVSRAARHREDLAGPDVHRHGGARLVADRILRGLLEVDVEAGRQPVALDRHPVVDRGVDLVARRVDTEDRVAGLALEQ
jgi:hypothetical protein